MSKAIVILKETLDQQMAGGLETLKIKREGRKLS